VLLEIDEGGGGKSPRAELIGGKNGGGREALCVFVGVGIEESAINDAEDGCGGAAAEREGEDGNSGESWRFTELAEGEAAIREDGMQPVADALFADLFFDLFDTTEFDACSALRFVGRHACADVFFG